MFGYWGEGNTLGLLTFLGYLAFVIGATIVWRGRDDIFIWLVDEAGSFRRTISRHEAVGPFYSPREESRLKVIPSQMVRTLSAIPRSRYSYGAFLLFLGPLLILLDFFI
jgi:hypothetical protein